ncbi:MAG: hypothetical protein IJY36_00865 [Coprobacter sp.]|nr:hypothetical protein [Coprobacter sp.]
MQKYTFGAIDIGSNAIRLLIDYVEEYKKPEFKKAAFVRVPIRLGEDVFSQGRISDAKIVAMEQALSAFSALFSTFRIDAYRAYATSAMREACNGAEIAHRIRRDYGINIEIVDGNTEAAMVCAAGGLEKVMDRSGSYLYIDVGGGSTEVVAYDEGCDVASASFRLGTVRYLAGTVSADEEARFSDWLTTVASLYKPTAVIGSGGNINKVHRLLDKKSKEPITRREIVAMRDRLNEMPLAARMEQLEISADRADVIVPALSIFATAMKSADVDRVVVPKLGLVDGIVRTLYHEYKERRN